MEIPRYFKARWYQEQGIRALESGVTFAVWCWSRRGGKDLTAFCYGIKKMVEQPMNVVIIWPTKKMGFDNFWTAVDNDGIPILDRIPEGLIKSKSSTKDSMSITLINGSTISLLGATDADALRGANAKLYILSEFVDLPPGLLGVIRPVIAVNGGKIIVQSTPKIDGTSGYTFQMLFERALKIWEEGSNSAKTPKQFASLVRATEYLTDEELEDIRQEYIAEYGSDFMFKQEFLCDWGQTSQTSYYGEALALMKDRKRIGVFPYNPHYPVFTVWDWGMSDNTAIGFFQYYKIGDQPVVRIIDSYETSDIGIKQLVAFIKTKPYDYAWHFFPHDTTVRDSDAIQRIEKFRDEGLLNSSILKREPVEDGIERVVAAFRKMVVMDSERTELLRRKLRKYKRKWNPETGDYVGAEHKSESHFADMVRYMMKAIEDEFDPKTCKHYYSQVVGVGVDEYDSEDIAQTAYA